MNIFETTAIKGNLSDLPIERIGQNLYRVQAPSGDKILEVLEVDIASKKMRIRYNHHTYWLTFQDELDKVLHKMGISSSNQSGDSSLKAPMPGRILEVLVVEGQEVKEGEGLLVLEAMKMENVLRSESSGTVKSIGVSANENVEKNQVLLEVAVD